MHPLSVEHRHLQLQIRNASLATLLKLWQAVDPTDLPNTIESFAVAASGVVELRHRLSAAAAASYYRRLRAAREAGGITALTDLPLPAPPDPGRAAGLIRGAALSGILNGRRAGQSVERAHRNGYVKLAGTATRLVLSGGRETIAEAARQDPASTGRWQRIAGAKACEFCLMLAGRGPAYSETSADFEAHNGCGCAAEPEFT